MKKAKTSRAKAPFKPDSAAAAKYLTTVRDFLRYAVSCFNQSGLFYGHGTFTAYDEAAYLVLEVLHLPIDQLEPYLDAVLTPAERKKLASLISARVTTRKPVPYLVNKAYLQGIPFYVDERVIVPRSYLAELLCNDDYGVIDDPDAITSVLDLCTGSGCLAVLAAHIFDNAVIDAVDLSKDALAVAKINVENSIFRDRITLYQGDLFKPLKGKKYDLIITNPPYVDKEGMTDMPPEYGHEPRMALASGDDGLDCVRVIMRDAPKHLNPGGKIICEVGYGRELIDETWPDVPFMWLDTEDSEGEVFLLTKEQFGNAKS